MKSLYDISWQVDEPTYRNDPALSFSLLSRFERSGFNGLPNLYDEAKSPSLTFGSAVDALITGGEKEFNNKFIVADFPVISEKEESIVRALFKEFHITHNKLSSIPDIEIIGRTEAFGYQTNWKPETRARVIKERAEDFYSLLYLSEDKEVLDNDTYLKVLNCVNTLKTSDATKWYFADNNILDDSVERYYQLKFKTDFKGITYRCMADLIIVDHKNKKIIPVDLKTSGHKEWDFYQSFLQWNYQIQARLYWRLINDTISKDDYFRNFTVDDYRFIVINKESLIPLIWICEFTKSEGLLEFHTNKNKHIYLEDPFTLGAKLNYYLNSVSRIPIDIDATGDNSISKFINSM